MKNAPRYTSYPTAPHFQSSYTSANFKQALKTINPTSTLSLYFHIPFCQQLCWFCGCLTKVTNAYQPINDYMTLLKKEVELCQPLLKANHVSHIHFGGGSPTIVSADDFDHFMQLIRSKFTILKQAEIAVEVDPRTVDRCKIASYVKAGVNRVSLGIQDFDPTVQAAINRKQSYEMVKKVVDQFREKEIDNINMDLIYGLPHQTIGTIKQTLHQTLDLKPSRISLFGYAHVPWIKKHQQLISEQSLPGTAERLEMFEQATKILVREGYIAVGLDHFVKPGDKMAKEQDGFEGSLQRNFQGYTTDNADALIGFGLSAISTLPQSYAQNISDYCLYQQSIQEGSIPTARGINLTKDDIERREIIMSLMCDMEVRIDEKKYQAELNRLLPYIQSKAVVVNNGYIEVNKAARHLVRLVAACFDAYLEGSEKQYSKAV